ncbi:MAG: PLP-dependent cysteine synthase family protein, partial [Candidatus Njordarchaeales archaeon]
MILDVIGRTPIVRLSRLVDSGCGDVYVKLEYLNPTGSHKDRIAYYMIRDAIEKGLMDEGGCVVEASSGNTAISVAWISSLFGLRAILVVERGASKVKVDAIRALGGEVVFSDPEECVEVARRIAEEGSCVFLDQRDNEANVRAHYETTGPEILEALGNVDAFVMGIGTGGTMCGVGKYLREKLGDKDLIVGVVPRGSIVVSPEATNRDIIEGLATYTVSGILKRYRHLIDRIVEVG